MTPGQLTVLSEIVQRFGLTSLQTTLRVCEGLSAEEPIDVAVLGQFKSGKSSLLNAVLGEVVFPVGVLPVTAVITRASAGAERGARITYLNGIVAKIPPSQLQEFVTGAGNPKNRQRAAVVDVFTPSLSDLQGVRLVDTPGLGSVFAHNTEATRNWMPNVSVALVTVSAERPLSDEDRRLVAEALQTAPRVIVILTKVDLLTDDELGQVTAFLDRALRDSFGDKVPVVPFSSRVESGRWAEKLRASVLGPLASNIAGERQAALNLKIASLAKACKAYLTLGLQAAERTDEDRQRLRAAVFNETVNAAVIQDELRLAEGRVCAGTRSAFTDYFLDRRPVLQERITNALADELRKWKGNLATQAQQYETWMAERLLAELAPLSQDAAPLGADLLKQAESRFRRIIEAFRDRLGRNVQEATGVVISPVTWEVKLPNLAVVPLALGRTFMTNWELLWWLLPMPLVGGLFRRHVLGCIPWEVEKNLIRLAGDWAGAADAAAKDLRFQATSWVDAELSTLGKLLGHAQSETTALREAVRRLTTIGALQPP